MHGHWDAPKEAAEIDAKEAADADYLGISKEYINMGIALVPPIDKLLMLIRDSERFQMVENAAEHLSGPLQGSVILQVDLATGKLIRRVDIAGQSPAPPNAAPDTPETD